FRYPNAICKPIALQFLSKDDVAILELIVEESNDIFHLSIVDERHYKLVSNDEITDDEIKLMSQLDE
ncbi:MAG: endonuclease, partial [Spirulina sp. DLM2.Bin59]